MPATATAPPSSLDACRDAAVLWTWPLTAWDDTAARELVGAWACAWDAWSAYVTQIATAAGPLEMFEAGAQLMADSFDVSGRAAAVRLRDGGVRAPLLNDA